MNEKRKPEIINKQSLEETYKYNEKKIKEIDKAINICILESTHQLKINYMNE